MEDKRFIRRGMYKDVQSSKTDLFYDQTLNGG